MLSMKVCGFIMRCMMGLDMSMPPICMWEWSICEWSIWDMSCCCAMACSEKRVHAVRHAARRNIKTFRLRGVIGREGCGYGREGAERLDAERCRGVEAGRELLLWDRCW